MKKKITFKKYLMFYAAVFLSSSALTLVSCDVAPPELYGGQHAVTNVVQLDMSPPHIEYPAGPYGNQAGDTLQDITLPGYRLSPEEMDSSQLTWVTDIKLSDFNANLKCKCLLLTWGASWCGACQQEQPALIDDVINDPTFCVLNILQEGLVNGSNKVTQQDVDDWTQRFMQNYPVVKGNAGSRALWNGWDNGGSIGLPFNLIVQPRTMTVLKNVQGFSPMIYDDSMSECAQ